MHQQVEVNKLRAVDPKKIRAVGLWQVEHWIHSLKLTCSPLKMMVSKSGISFSRGLFSGGKLLVSGRIVSFKNLGDMNHEYHEYHESGQAKTFH